MRLLRYLLLTCSLAAPATFAILAVLPAAAAGETALPARELAIDAAPGSTAPRLTSGAGGRLVLSWTEPAGEGHRLMYAVLGEGWGEPVMVASGEGWFVNWADFPSVLPLSDELWAAHWLVRRPAGGYAYDIAMATSTDGGATWSEPVTPHTDDTDSEHGFVTLFPHPGGFGAIWLDGRNTVRPPGESPADSGMTLRTATFDGSLAAADQAEIDGLVCDCCQTDAASTPAGPVAVYRDRSEDEIRDISVARFVDGRWEPGVRVATDEWRIPGCPVNGPAIDAQGSRVAVAWFSAAGDRPRVSFAWSADSGASFGAPVEVASENNYGRARVALLGDGDAAVSWLCRTPEDGAGVCLRRVTAEGRAGPVRTLSAAAGTPALSVPQLARDGETLIVAWTRRDDDGTRIASARISADSL